MRPTAPALQFTPGRKTPLECAVPQGIRIVSQLSAELTPFPAAIHHKNPPRSQHRRAPVRRSTRSGEQQKHEPRGFIQRARKILNGFGAVGLFLFLGACVPPTPAQKATEAARSLNMAARWGKMDEARGLNDPSHLSDFQKNHALWHNKIRIVETELAGLNMKDATHATVQVDVSWNFANDPTLRVTRLTQEWSDAEGSWVMISDEFLEGDPGLFGEEVEDADKKRDTHFPSKVIR